MKTAFIEKEKKPDSPERQKYYPNHNIKTRATKAN